MAMTDEQNKILDHLEAQCAKREYCTADVRQKALKALAFDSDAAEEVVAKLVEERFVDDSRYAAAFAREKAALNGWGPVKIRFALSSKGITGKAADSALEEIDEGAAEKRLRELLAAKIKSLGDDPQWKIKTLKHLLSRGYNYDEISRAIASLKESE